MFLRLLNCLYISYIETEFEYCSELIFSLKKKEAVFLKFKCCNTSEN